jgi:hypothetical protein
MYCNIEACKSKTAGIWTNGARAARRANSIIDHVSLYVLRSPYNPPAFKVLLGLVKYFENSDKVHLIVKAVEPLLWPTSDIRDWLTV